MRDLSDTWDKISDDAWSRGYVPEETTNNINKYFNKLLHGKNLDLCCGFWPTVNNSTGIDISQKSLDELKIRATWLKRKYSPLLQFDLNSLENKLLPFDDDMFYSATIIFGWNYITPLDALLKEVKRVVKPEGRFFVIQYEGFSYGIDRLVINSHKAENVYGFLNARGLNPDCKKIDERATAVYITV